MTRPTFCDGCAGTGRVAITGALCRSCRGTGVPPSDRWQLTIVAWGLRLPGSARVIRLATRYYATRGAAKAMAHQLIRRARVALGHGTVMVPLVYDPAGELVEVHCTVKGELEARWHSSDTAPSGIWTMGSTGVA